MMNSRFPSQLFVTGTDTDVGKTVLSGVLCQGLQANYWKPVQAGFPTDSETMAAWIGSERIFPEANILSHPLSPNQSAERDGVALDLAQIQLPKTEQPLVVEGAGGLMVPINDKHMMIDLIHHLKLPVVIAARSALGTLNHSLLSIEALKKRQIPIVGVVLMGPSHPDNTRDIAHFGQVDILGRIDHLPELSGPQLLKAFQAL